MRADSKTIERSIRLLRIAGNLERVGVLATNTCKDVIYAIEGKIIKHPYN